MVQTETIPLTLGRAKQPQWGYSDLSHLKSDYYPRLLGNPATSSLSPPVHRHVYLLPALPPASECLLPISSPLTPYLSMVGISFDHGFPLVPIFPLYRGWMQPLWANRHPCNCPANTQGGPMYFTAYFWPSQAGTSPECTFWIAHKVNLDQAACCYQPLMKITSRDAYLTLTSINVPIETNRLHWHFAAFNEIITVFYGNLHNLSFLQKHSTRSHFSLNWLQFLTESYLILNGSKSILSET